MRSFLRQKPVKTKKLATSQKASNDARGLSRLVVDGINGIVDIVEEVHKSIVTLGGRRAMASYKGPGPISRFVYGSIRSITGSVGHGLDAVLNRFTFLLDEQESTPRREAVLSILNGVLGDYLEASGNPLNITMKLRREGEKLEVNDPEFGRHLGKSGGKVVLMIHGLCMNDLQWTRKDHNHGSKLQQELGYLPIHLHYNTGLHISQNGRNLADLLEKLYASENRPSELLLLTHSMGGLVARSALYYAKEAGYHWPKSVNKLIFLGTPHHGAQLERGGNWIDNVLEKNAFSAPFSRIGKIRSAGVTDLRYGNVLDEDWKGRDRFRLKGDQRHPVPLPDDIACYAIAATSAKKPGNRDSLVGDGLVTPMSGLGRHPNPKFDLQLPDSRVWIARDRYHLDLLSSTDIYDKIKEWLIEDTGN